MKKSIPGRRKHILGKLKSDGSILAASTEKLFRSLLERIVAAEAIAETPSITEAAPAEPSAAPSLDLETARASYAAQLKELKEARTILHQLINNIRLSFENQIDVLCSGIANPEGTLRVHGNRVRNRAQTLVRTVSYARLTQTPRLDSMGGLEDLRPRMIAWESRLLETNESLQALYAPDDLDSALRHQKTEHDNEIAFLNIDRAINHAQLTIHQFMLDFPKLNKMINLYIAFILNGKIVEKISVGNLPPDTVENPWLAQVATINKLILDLKAEQESLRGLKKKLCDDFSEIMRKDIAQLKPEAPEKELLNLINEKIISIDILIETLAVKKINSVLIKQQLLTQWSKADIAADKPNLRTLLKEKNQKISRKFETMATPEMLESLHNETLKHSLQEQIDQFTRFLMGDEFSRPMTTFVQLTRDLEAEQFPIETQEILIANIIQADKDTGLLRATHQQLCEARQLITTRAIEMFGGHEFIEYFLRMLEHLMSTQDELYDHLQDSNYGIDHCAIRHDLHNRCKIFCFLFNEQDKLESIGLLFNEPPAKPLLYLDSVSAIFSPFRFIDEQLKVIDRKISLIERTAKENAIRAAEITQQVTELVDLDTLICPEEVPESTPAGADVAPLAQLEQLRTTEQALFQTSAALLEARGLINSQLALTQGLIEDVSTTDEQYFLDPIKGALEQQLDERYSRLELLQEQLNRRIDETDNLHEQSHLALGRCATENLNAIHNQVVLVFVKLSELERSLNEFTTSITGKEVKSSYSPSTGITLDLLNASYVISRMPKLNRFREQHTEMIESLTKLKEAASSIFALIPKDSIQATEKEQFEDHIEKALQKTEQARDFIDQRSSGYTGMLKQAITLRYNHLCSKYGRITEQCRTLKETNRPSLLQEVKSMYEELLSIIELNQQSDSKDLRGKLTPLIEQLEIPIPTSLPPAPPVPMSQPTTSASSFPTAPPISSAPPSHTLPPPGALIVHAQQHPQTARPPVASSTLQGLGNHPGFASPWSPPATDNPPPRQPVKLGAPPKWSPVASANPRLPQPVKPGAPPKWSPVASANPRLPQPVKSDVKAPLKKAPNPKPVAVGPKSLGALLSGKAPSHYTQLGTQTAPTSSSPRKAPSLSRPRPAKKAPRAAREKYSSTQTHSSSLPSGSFARKEQPSKRPASLRLASPGTSRTSGARKSHKGSRTTDRRRYRSLPATGAHSRSSARLSHSVSSGPITRTRTSGHPHSSLPRRHTGAPRPASGPGAASPEEVLASIKAQRKAARRSGMFGTKKKKTKKHGKGSTSTMTGLLMTSGVFTSRETAQLESQLRRKSKKEAKAKKRLAKDRGSNNSHSSPGS